MLANQQEDLDGLIQNIVTNLGKGSRKGLMEGLREIIKIDKERALEVGYLNLGMGTFEVRNPKGPEGCLEVTVRESPVGTLKTYIISGLREFIKIDNQCALEVGHLRKGLGTFSTKAEKIRRIPRGDVRESRDEV